MKGGTDSRSRGGAWSWATTAAPGLPLICVLKFGPAAVRVVREPALERPAEAVDFPVQWLDQTVCISRVASADTRRPTASRRNSRLTYCTTMTWIVFVFPALLGRNPRRGIIQEAHDQYKVWRSPSGAYPRFWHDAAQKIRPAFRF